jgi:hypothetical protein
MRGPKWRGIPASTKDRACPLQAGGYSQAQAEHACTALKAAGLSCLVTAH